RLPFVNDTHAVFAALQGIMEAASGEAAGELVAVGIDGLLRMSALYREAMLRQVRVLQEAGAPSEFIVSEIETFQSMHAVWHLLEIIYLTTNMPGLSISIVPHFMEWLNLNFPVPSSEDGQRIVDSLGTESLALNTDLWPYLKKLALRGHVATLANMLERVAPAQELSSSAARWARDIARVARDMPLGSNEETSGSFNARWRRWNEELQNTVSAIDSLISGGKQPEANDAELESLYAIADVMRGNADAISAESKSWQDMLGAILLYSEPTSQADRLPSLAGIMVEQFQASEFSVLDRALVALLNHELPEFLVYCNQIDTWLSAHISDLMDHISILDMCRATFAVDPREHYLLALGESYLSHENLWRVGLDYLGLIGSQAGNSVMEEYAMRIPLESDTKAQQRGRLGAAISHFAQVSDRRAVGQICDQLWDEYLATGELSYGPTIDGVMASGLRHDRLQFLTKYRDFHECYKVGEFADAGKILLHILLSEIAPPYAIADLLVDAIPLLEGDELVFDSDATFELMRCAETLLTQPPPASGTVDQGEMSIFSVACARNLARSFLV
ncbi:Nucleoporin nup85, partial [Coemansia sp. RSA 2673]